LESNTVKYYFGEKSIFFAYLVILIYRPPSSVQDNTAELCEILRCIDKNTVIIGDFNMPGIDWTAEQSRDTRGRELLETVVEEGLQ
jgi:hypothetical protein